MTCSEAYGDPAQIKDKDDLELYFKATSNSFFSSYKLFNRISFPDLYPTDHPDNDDNDDFEDEVYNGENYEQQFKSIIEEYSTRELSFHSDAVNAISGVLAVFEKSLFPISNIQGIPWEEKSADCFCNGLAWCHLSPQKAQREMQFPSWSWAGWGCSEINWVGTGLNLNGVGISDYKSYLENVAVEDESGFCALIIQAQDFLQRTATRSQVRTAKVISFDAPVVTKLLSFDSTYNTPLKWSDCQLGGYKIELYNGLNPLPYTAEDAIQNFHKGLWECIPILEFHHVISEALIVLVIEWHDPYATSRVGALRFEPPEMFSRTWFSSKNREMDSPKRIRLL
jgi:hypothetical protein